jgi:hypothetical protein
MEVTEHASCQCHCLSLGMAPKKIQNWTVPGQVERASFDGYLYLTFYCYVCSVLSILCTVCVYILLYQISNRSTVYSTSWLSLTCRLSKVMSPFQLGDLLYHLIGWMRGVKPKFYQLPRPWLPWGSSPIREKIRDLVISSPETLTTRPRGWSCVHMCIVLLPPSVNPIAVKCIYHRIKEDVVVVGAESVRLLVVHHNTVRVPPLRTLRAAERVVKCGYWAFITTQFVFLL